MIQYQRHENELVEVFMSTLPEPNKCRTAHLTQQRISIHPQHSSDFEFNKLYAEDEFQTIAVTVEDEIKNPEWKGDTHISYFAIPKQKETEDELWNEVGEIIINGYEDSTQEEILQQLKSKFIISKI